MLERIMIIISKIRKQKLEIILYIKYCPKNLLFFRNENNFGNYIYVFDCINIFC